MLKICDQYFKYFIFYQWQVSVVCFLLCFVLFCCVSYDEPHHQRWFSVTTDNKVFWHWSTMIPPFPQEKLINKWIMQFASLVHKDCSNRNTDLLQLHCFQISRWGHWWAPATLLTLIRQTFYPYVCVFLCMGIWERGNRDR